MKVIFGNLVYLAVHSISDAAMAWNAVSKILNEENIF